VDDRHLHVEKNNIQSQRVERGEHLLAVAALTCDDEARERREQLAHAATRGRLIVGDQNAPLHHVISDSSTSSRYGTRSVAIVPDGRLLAIVSDARSPYNARSRSRVFSIPWPAR